MRTVKEVSSLTGVRIRALHHYDAIGLLPPSKVTEAGYRLYDDTALERLQLILLYRELRFPLREIKNILDSPSFHRQKALEQQLAMLRMQKAHIQKLIDLACDIYTFGGSKMDFSAFFGHNELENYAAQAKAAWGSTAAYQEYVRRASNRSSDDERALGAGLMELFREFGAMRSLDAASPEVQLQVKKLQDYISANYYLCTPELLRSLAAMYEGGGAMTENIQKAGGEGTAQLAAAAIRIYCDRA